MPSADATFSSATLEVVNPYDLSRVETLAVHGPDDAERTLSIAYGLFRNRERWLPLYERVSVLERAAGLIGERLNELATLVVREGGKPLRDARAEVSRAAEIAKACVAAMRNDAGDVLPMNLSRPTGERMAFTRREPVGMVAAVGAYSDPFGLIVEQAAPAVAAGCPVVAKPAAETPLSCLAFLDILAEAGLPTGWAQAIVTDDEAAAGTLAADPRTGFFSFVGPADAGWRLRSKLAPGARCALGHGGAAPVVVADDIDIYEVREALLPGCFRHAGQSGVSVRRVFAHTRVATRFATQLAMKASGLLVGDPMLEETDMGPLIRPDELARVHERVCEAVDGGGQLLTGGAALTDTLYAPTVIFNPPPDCRLMTEETFGPVVCVAPWFRVRDALELANGLPTAFQAAVFTRDIDAAMEIAAGLDASAVMVNDHAAFRADWTPFGGWRSSGLGAGTVAGAIRGLQAEKAIVLRTSRLETPPDAAPA